MTEVYSIKESYKQGPVPFCRGSRFLFGRRCVIWLLLVVLRLLSMAYAKSWTDKYNDGWYLSLKLHERGLWDQLFTYAKMVGDTGRIIGRSWSAWGSLWGCDGRTCRKIVTKMHDDGKVVLRVQTNFLELEIVNYEYYQRVKKLESKNAQGNMLQKCSLKQSRAEQSIPEHIPPSAPTTPKEKKETEHSDHKKFVTFWNDGYREEFNSDYPWTPKDFKGIQRILKIKGMHLEALQELAALFWKQDDQFVVSAGHTVGIFSTRLAALQEQALKPRELQPGDKRYVPH